MQKYFVSNKTYFCDKNQFQQDTFNSDQLIEPLCFLIQSKLNANLFKNDITRLRKTWKKNSIRPCQHFMKQCKKTWKSCGCIIFFNIVRLQKKGKVFQERLGLGITKMILLQNFLSSKAEVVSFVNKLFFLPHYPTFKIPDIIELPECAFGYHLHRKYHPLVLAKPP